MMQLAIPLVRQRSWGDLMQRHFDQAVVGHVKLLIPSWL